MGAWGTSLYANDYTCDVRDTYIELLKEQLSNNDAYQKTLEQLNEYIGTENEPFFWYALADTQWRLGRLMQEVKIKALFWIKKDGGLALWEESKSRGAGWKKTLNKLENQLESPMPPEKSIKKPIEFIRNLWNVGEIYAYHFHTDIAKGRGLFGKYIIFQKVGNDEWYDGRAYSIIQVFNRVFDEIPTCNEIGEIRILPLVYPLKGHQKHKNNYVPSFEFYFKAIMIYEKKTHYPAKHFTYIGNNQVQNVEYEHTQYTEWFWEKDKMEDWLSDFYIQWQNLEY